MIARELAAYRAERALRETLQSAQEYRKQLDTVLTRSNDAIAQVQEGIVVEVNQSWLDLIGCADARDVVGQPVMDFFDEANHAALKGALVACLKGLWKDHSLRADVRTADGGTLTLELVLTLGEREGEPCVRMMVPSQKRANDDVARDLTDAVQRNPRTGLLNRVPLLAAIQQRMARRVQGGGRYLIYLRLDGFAKLEKELGVLRSEDFLVALAALLRPQLRPPTSPGISTAPASWCWPNAALRATPKCGRSACSTKSRTMDSRSAARASAATACAALAPVPVGGSKLDCHRRRRAGCRAPRPQQGGNRLVKVGQTETEARGGRGRGVGEGDPRCAGREPLQPGAATHHQPVRRRAADRHGGAHDRHRRARRSCPRSSCPAPNAAG